MECGGSTIGANGSQEVQCWNPEYIKGIKPSKEPIEIRLAWHRFLPEDGKGGHSQSFIDQQIKFLNQTYQGWNIQFKLFESETKVDEVLYKGLKSSEDVEREFGDLVHQEDKKVIHIFSVDKIVDGGLWLAGGSSFTDAYIMLGNSASLYTLTHEVGHVLGLDHTWEEDNLDFPKEEDGYHCVDFKCEPALCDEDNQETYLPSNLMSLTNPYCDEDELAKSFTHQQYQSMLCYLHSEHPSLIHFVEEGEGTEPSKPVTATVGPEGDYSTIQEAIMNVPDGSVIEIAGGIYQENLLIKHSKLTLRGRDGETVYLEGEAVGYPPVLEIGDHADVNLENLVISAQALGIYSNPQAKVLLHNSQVEIAGVEIGGNPQIQGLEIFGGTLKVAESGFFLNGIGALWAWEGAKVFLDDTFFSGNSGLEVIYLNDSMADMSGGELVDNSAQVDVRLVSTDSHAEFSISSSNWETAEGSHQVCFGEEDDNCQSSIQGQDLTCTTEKVACEVME